MIKQLSTKIKEKNNVLSIPKLQIVINKKHHLKEIEESGT